MKLFVPRLLDRDNHNPQNMNAKSMLAHWPPASERLTACRHGAVEPDFLSRGIDSLALTDSRCWRAWLAWYYARGWDGIFYPGVDIADDLGSALFAKLRGRPLVATIEGLVGDCGREKICSEIAGQPVYCQPVSARVLRRVDRIYRRAKHIIAISPLLYRIAVGLYGDKCSWLPLGVDLNVFHAEGRESRADDAVTVVGAGRVAAHKRPEVFLELARRFPAVRFIWYGDGPLRGKLLDRIRMHKLDNADLPGAVTPEILAAAMRAADIFVLPSLAEGAPRVVQEAAACGLPVIAFGHYQPLSVRDGVNGILVWNDTELTGRLTELIGDPRMRESFGAAGAAMAREWDWSTVAVRWRDRVIGVVSAG